MKHSFTLFFTLNQRLRHRPDIKGKGDTLTAIETTKDIIMKLIYVTFLSALLFSCEQQNSGFDKDELKKENIVLTEGSERDIIDPVDRM